MPESRRKFIVGLVLILTAGGVIGWVYDKPMLGALIAALLALIWQVRQLLSFERERAQLHAKIGQQAVELDWLTKKSKQLGL